MATLSDETCFGDLFKRFAPFLKMYVEYCTQHENTASRVSLIASKNDKFSNLLHVSYRSCCVRFLRKNLAVRPTRFLCPCTMLRFCIWA